MNVLTKIGYDNLTVEIEFPIDDDSLEKILRDNYMPTDTTKPFYVRSIDSPNALSGLEGRTVNLDELNFLAKRMECFFGDEYDQFSIAVERTNATNLKDMINLTFNLDKYTLIKDSELVEKEQNADLGDMKDYFYDDDNAQAKMVTARWGIAEKNGALYGKVDFKLREPFTAEEKEKVRDWVSGQNSDGFGEGLEQRPIETEDGDLYVSMWGADNYFIYDENEMNEYLSQQQSGGMKL